MFFTYQCLDKKGRPKDGRIDAESLAQARHKLKKKGWKILFVKEVGSTPEETFADPDEPEIENVVFFESQTELPPPPEKKKGSFLADRWLRRGDKASLKPKDDSWMGKVRCPANVVVLFTRQLATLLRSGFPIVQALDTLSFQEEFPNFGEVVATLSARLEQGHSFSSCLALFPRVFSKAYVSMVAIGERTGQLDGVLDRLAGWLEHDSQTFQRVKGAISYPLFVLALSVILGLVIFYTVLPGFVEILERMEVELPLLTRVIFAVTNAVKNPGAWLALVAAGTIFVLKLKDFNNSRKGALRLYRVARSVPVVGNILVFSSVSRYAAAVGALLGSGVDLITTLRLSAEASGSPLLKEDAEKMIQDVSSGLHLSEHMMMRPDIYPPTVSHLVVAGEEASDLPMMFERLAAYYDSELNYRLESFSAALEPILIVGVGGVVATVVLSIFQPMYGYLATLGA